MGTISGGINLGAPILPATEEDIFPTHDAQYGKGGYRAVLNVAARDAIPVERLAVGSIVKTMDTGTNWIVTAIVNIAGQDTPQWEAEQTDGGTF